MQDLGARNLKAMNDAQQRNAKHLRFATLIAILIGLLLWRTLWPALRPGLTVLLVGQIGAALMLLFRNILLARRRQEVMRDPADQVSFQRWIDSEAVFIRLLASVENWSRLIGFVFLAYGFWLSTRSLLIAAVIGVIYPVTMYFGIARKNTARTLKELEARRNQF